MLGAAGILNIISWTIAGEAKYFMDPATLFVIELILFVWAKGMRWADIIKPGSVNVNSVFLNNKLTGTNVGYPKGLWFDPLGWRQTKNAVKLKDLRT
jgi:light-harvesting complex I chlorophyll a/b binding protein 2